MKRLPSLVENPQNRWSLHVLALLPRLTLHAFEPFPPRLRAHWMDARTIIFLSFSFLIIQSDHRPFCSALGLPLSLRCRSPVASGDQPVGRVTVTDYSGLDQEAATLPTLGRKREGPRAYS